MQNNGIRFFTTRYTLKCTWWPLTPILTLYEVTQLGNRAKSVQECLLIQIILVVPYPTNMQANHKITSQTTILKCTWWPLMQILTFTEVTKFVNRTKSVLECLLISKSLIAPYSTKVPTNPKITSHTTTLKCTWWSLTPILTLHEVSQLGNQMKSVQEYLLMSIGLIAPHSAKVPTHPKITSQTTFLKCIWWPLTPILTLYEVTQLGNRAKSVQECLQILISLVAPYAAKVPTNPKITSQTTSLKISMSQ